MGSYVTRESFEWEYSDQPHTDRRKEMLRKYPQIKQLMSINPHFKWIVTAQVAAQIVACYFAKDVTWHWFLLWAYFVGGTLNHSLTLAIHETSHNRAFGHGANNRLNAIFAMAANLPIGIPYSASFKKYHLDHHRCQGVDGIDTDIPMNWEAHLFCTTLRKILWVALQPFLYAIRPLVINPKPLIRPDLVNLAVQLAFNVLVLWAWGGQALGYFFLSTYLGLGLHPIAGHFIAEHYMFLKGHETYSYYGPLNVLAYNVGYHMEHHDFPSIPGSKLPMLRKIVPEYYEDLPQYRSWARVIVDFVTDNTIGPYSRVKRSVEFATENGRKLPYFSYNARGDPKAYTNAVEYESSSFRSILDSFMHIFDPIREEWRLQTR